MKRHREKRGSRRYRLNKVSLAGLIACIILASVLLHNRTTGTSAVRVHAVMTLPFVLLLLSIAVAPFISARWWERNYAYASFGLALISIAYYALVLKNGGRMVRTAAEYYSFMALIGSLFVVSGGIYIKIKGRSTPLRNTILLAVGAAAANFLGTTGASMALIRPYLRTNKYRVSGYHVVFFIFLVSNIGGMLTPIGDPPLFLGYLKGVPFFWVFVRIWPIWAIATGFVLAVFYFIDRRHFKKLPAALERKIEEEEEHATIGGYGNIALLAAILGAVFMRPPVREIVMLLAAVTSCLTTRRDVHDRNEFSFAPVKEVAILFAGIFATMTPMMDWVEMNAGSLKVARPGQFYWAVGAMSSFLDNAPTYLGFLSLACGRHGLNVDNLTHVKALLGLLPPREAASLSAHLRAGAAALTPASWRYVLAISAGAVMFGANTYVANGPNFMVKSIAEQAHVRMPSFFGYMVKYSIPVLMPIFVVIWLLFFL